MENITKNTGPTPENEVDFLNTAAQYGLIGGAVMVVFSLVTHLAGLSDGSNGNIILGSILSGIAVIAAYAICQVLAVRKHRKEELGGYISFKRAFLVCVIVALGISMISALWNFVYLNFIDPEFINRVLDNTQEFMENMDMPEEVIEEAMEDARAGIDPSLVGSLKSVLGTLIFGSFIGLIVAAATKKEAPLS